MFFRLIFTILLISQHAYSKTLTLEEYLKEVEDTYSFNANKLNYEAFTMQQKEATAIYIPNFFISGTIQENETPNITNNLYNEKTQIVQTGVNFLTPFGLSGNAFFQTAKYNADTLAIQESEFFQDAFGISITQELWKNGFGKTTRSMEKMIVAQKMQTAFQSMFENKQLILNAKISFWNLSANFEMLKIINEGLKMANDILKYTKERFEMGVFEKADLLKFEFLAKQLEYLKKQTMANLHANSINFNMMRGIASEHIKEKILFASSNFIQSLSLPEMDFEREDLKALLKQVEATKENYNISQDAYTPAVTLSANISSNGYNPSSNTALTQARKNEFTNKGIALNINIPLGSVTTLNDGYKMAQLASKKSYEASVINAQSAILNIKKDFEDLKQLIAMQEEIIVIAKAKLEEERRRYKLGRTTSLQLYTEEQDYINANLTLINLKLQILQVYETSLTYKKEL